MHQNVVAFHAANGMLNKDPDLTQGGIGSFVLIAQLWVGFFLLLRGFFVGMSIRSPV